MANLMNIISPRQCGVVKERNKSKQKNNTASSSHTHYNFVSTFFNFGQYSTSSTFENMEAGDDHRDDSTVNVDSDVDLFSTMNSGKDRSPQGKPIRRSSPQNSFDKNNKVLNFDGCMLHRKRCSGTCVGDSATLYGTNNSSTTSSSCKRDRYHHMRKSPSTRSMVDRRGSRCSSHSTGSSDSFEHDNDSTKICESFSIERDNGSIRSCESSVERKKRISSSFILSRNDSIDLETISTSASFQSKESNLSLSDLFSKETNTLDSGTLSASASFQSKDTIGNLTSSDLYSKETLTEENYDSSDSRSESKSTLTSKDSIIKTTKATFHFDRFFRKDSYTDTYDSSDSRSESTTTGTTVEDEEEENDYSSDHSRSSSYTFKSHCSEAGTERDDNTFQSEMDNFHTTRVITSPEHNGQFLIESKQNIESLIESETSSTSGCTTSFDETPFDGSPMQDDMVLACRSPMEFSAAIEDISEHDSNMNVVLQPTALDNPSLPKQSLITSQTKIASDRADYIVVSLADDTTEISITNMTSSCSDFIVYDSFMDSVRTDDLYDPKDSGSTHEQYGISQHTNLSSKSFYDGALFSNVISAQNYYSRADEIAISHAVEVHNTFSYAGSSVSSCHDVNPLDQTLLVNDVEQLEDTLPPPPPPPYDTAFSDVQNHLQQLLTSSNHPSYDQQRCTGSASDSETDKASDVGAKQNTSKLQNAIDATYNSETSLNRKDSFSNIDRCAPDPLLKGPVHYNNDTEMIIDDTAASHPLPALSLTSDQKSITNSHDKAPDVGAKQNTSKLQNAIDAIYNSESSLNWKDSFSNVDRCAPDPLLKGPVHNNKGTEMIIDGTAASHPLPALSSTSDQRSITNPHNDYGASSLNPLSLSSTDTPLNPLKRCMGFYVDDVNSSSFIQSSDRTRPTNQLETSVCLLEDDLSFFTAMNEPQLSIETDSNSVTAANSAQRYILADFFQGCVENSLKCDSGDDISSSLLTRGDNIADGRINKGDEVQCLSRDIELKRFKSSVDEALFVGSNKMSVDNDQTDSMAKNAGGTLEAAASEEKFYAMIEQLDSNDNIAANMISTDSNINQIFHGNKSKMQRIEVTPDTTIEETDLNMAKNARGTVEAATSEEKLCEIIEKLDSNDYNAVNMILTDSDINRIFHGNKSEMQQIEDTPDTTINEADSNEIQKARFKAGEKVSALSGEYSDQVTAAMSEILLHCQRLKVLDEGISQEAVHERINSAVMKIVQVCRQFDVSADSFSRNTVSNGRLSQKLESVTEVDEDMAKYESQIEKEQPCNDFAVEGTSSIEQGKISEKVLCTHYKHLFKELAKPADLSAEPFKDNYPVSPSKTPRRSNQRRRAARLMEGLNSLKSTHDYENTESKETIQLKEASPAITALSVGVEDTLKIPETQALASPYRLIRQLAFPSKAFQKQNVADTESVRDTLFNSCRTGRRSRVSTAAATGERPTCQINKKDFVQNDKTQDETNDEIMGSSILKNKDPTVHLGNALALSEREESAIDNTTETGRKGSKHERKLNRKQSERNNRFFKRNTTTELTKETEMAKMTSVLKGTENKVSQMVSSTDRLKNALEVYEKHHLSEATNAGKIGKKCLHVSSCDLDEQDDNTLDNSQSLRMRMSTDDVTDIAPSANDPSAHVSPSKQCRRLERAAKMLDLRKNKNRSIKNERGELDLTFLNDSSAAGKDSPKTTHQPYDNTVKMHVEKSSFREEVVMLTSSGSSTSFKASSLSVDTAVQDYSFDETVCTTKHSNVFSSYLRCPAPLTPDSRLTDRETVGKVDHTYALQHPSLSPPKSLYSTPRSFRKVSSPAAARDRIKNARKLWHTNNGSTYKPFE